MGRWWVGVVLGVALVLGAGACDSGGSETTSTTGAHPRASLQMRPVVMNTVAGGSGAPGQTVLDSAQPSGVRYVVEAPVVTEHDVRDALAIDTQTQGWFVELELTNQGVRALDRLARELYPKSPPQNSIAIVVDGKVQSAAAFQQSSFTGDTVGVYVPGMTEREAKAMAASLRR